MTLKLCYLTVFISLFTLSIQKKYKLQNLDIKKNNSVNNVADDENHKLYISLNQLNKTGFVYPTLSATKRVCKFRNCTDNPMMTRDLPRRNTFFFTFTQVSLSNSNSNNVSLENSQSSTFFDFDNNFSEKKLKNFNSTDFNLKNNFINYRKYYVNSDKLRSIDINNMDNKSLSTKNSEKLNINLKSENFLQNNNENNNINDSVKKRFTTRVKRRINLNRWISQEYEGEEEMMKMHAFIVRDEVIPNCCKTAKSISDTRYFMCSGAILTLTHAITTASCMHFADFYEKHIKAHLAVLVGGSTSSPYVIKINRYEIHPNYIYDIDNPNYAKHNIAILYLSCGFSFMMGTIVPPKLPKGIYDDVGHICCGQNCELITIVQKADNHHVARVLKAKHIPLPLHDLDNDNNKNPVDSRRTMKMRKLHKVKRDVSSWIRYKRSSGKRAEAPSFIFKDDTAAASTTTAEKKIEKNYPNSNRKSIKDIFVEIANAKKQPARKVLHAKNNHDTNSILTSDGRRELIQNIASNLSLIDEKLMSADWIKIENLMESKIPNANKEKIEQFAKIVVDETVKRLGSVIDIEQNNNTLNVDDKNISEKNNIFMSLMAKNNETRTFHGFTNLLTEIITSLLPPNDESKLSVSSDLIIEEKDLVLPKPKYVNCPPLGTPIFKNETLIAMVAYTCDDAESWVEWKYVSISRNLNWIQQRLAIEQQPPPTLCDSPFSDEEIGLDELIHGSRSLRSRKNLPIFLKNLKNNEAYNIIRNQLKIAKKTRKHSNNTVKSTSDDEIYSHSQHFNPNWRKTSTFIKDQPDDVININSNTCMTRPDGTTECQSLSETNKDQ